MAVEIELKARLDDPEPVKRRLASQGIFCRSYEKNDTYWTAPDGNTSCPELPRSGVRLRLEITTGAEGCTAETALVTYKTREMRDGVEINDEREFALASAPSGNSAAQGGRGPDSTQSAAQEPPAAHTEQAMRIVEDLLGRLGLKPGIKKEKRGWAWTITAPGAPPILAELSMVKNLGWFLELEILAEARDRQTITQSRNRLLSLLEKLGIPPEQIEPRPYSQLLKETQAAP
jgi:adenylate cyclase class 2